MSSEEGVGRESETHPAFENWVKLKSCCNTYAPSFRAARFADWPYSSFHRYVRCGIYNFEWAANDNVRRLEMEYDAKGGMRFAFPPYGPLPQKTANGKLSDQFLLALAFTPFRLFTFSPCYKISPSRSYGNARVRRTGWISPILPVPAVI